MVFAQKGASSFTAQINRDATGLYAMTDRRDFTDVDRDRIAPWPGTALKTYATLLDEFDINFPIVTA